MEVYKFGGTSLQDAHNVRQVVAIIQNRSPSVPLLLVVSALGKTTRALEKVAAAYWCGDSAGAEARLQDIIQKHIALLRALIPQISQERLDVLEEMACEVYFTLSSAIEKDYAYYYDQIVSVGELLSSKLLSLVLEAAGCGHQWLDIRDVLITDETFQSAHILEDQTRRRASQISSLLYDCGLVLTQGFIGGTLQNETTTLGKEGSDFSAAFLAALLSVQRLTIWKDVAGIMSADPKKQPEARLLTQIDYQSVQEMAYLGAQVIHPKTLYPLQEKNIPLWVRSFAHTALSGSVITAKKHPLPPVVIEKEGQWLITLKPLSPHCSGDIFLFLSALTDYLQSAFWLNFGAAAILLACDAGKWRHSPMAQRVEELFAVEIRKDITQLNILYPDSEIIADLLKGKTVLLEQKSSELYRYLLF